MGEAAEGPPRGWKLLTYTNPDAKRKEHHFWKLQIRGRHWYEKGDGCFIYRKHTRSVRSPLEATSPPWYICSPDGDDRYTCQVTCTDAVDTRGRVPAPTLRVVN